MVALLTDSNISSAVTTMDEQLTKLITEAQKHPAESQERQKILTQMVDEIMRSRKICRMPKGQSLYGVYQEIYQQVRRQLLHDVDEALDSYNVQRTTVREWANILRLRACKKILDDARLQRLALIAQESKPQTEERDYALIELLEAIRLSGKLCRPHIRKIPAEFYQLIYEEAVNKTLLYICRNINNYDPNRGRTGSLMTWVNFRLDRVVIEVWGEFLKSEKSLSSEDIGNLPTPQEEPSLFEIIRECIEEDADKIFQRKQMRNRPDANFRAIALATMSGKSWEEISAQFGRIKVAALSNFFQRCCRHFAPKFREYL
ncbi:hypothetical protein [Scytonema sp. PCC 10023]|uniref:hypothetical protein n=1 Tax=Scytonema sp. PCC 10023 TaxID=1680591 RepID=UPI0039C60003